MRVLVLAAATAALAVAADPWLETQLAQPILAPRQTLIETQIHLASRVKPMPAIADRAAWERYVRDLRAQILENVVFRGEAAKWRDAAVQVEWLDTIAANGYRVKKFRYEAVPGMWMAGPVVRARAGEWTRAGHRQPNGHEGDGKANSYIQERCINLAKEGHAGV